MGAKGTLAAHQARKPNATLRLEVGGVTERAVVIDEDMALAISGGAEFCAKLAAIEHAHLIGDEENVDTLLSTVDPIDARLCANQLRALAMVWDVLTTSREDRGRSTEAPPLNASTTPAAHTEGSERATAPIPFPGHSVRCN